MTYEPHDLVGLHLHIDGFAGVAGDMTLGAFLDLGMPLSVVIDVVTALGLKEVSLEALRVEKRGIWGTGFRVHTKEAHSRARHKPHSHSHSDEHGHSHSHDDEHSHGHSHGHSHEHGGDHVHGAEHSHSHDDDSGHRHFREIRELVAGADLFPAVKQRALNMFTRIARAEAHLHGVSIDDVHFHEVGAIDSLVDVVGTAAAIEWLAPKSISARPPTVGQGTFKCAHGVLPAPSPAALEILRGVPIEYCSVQHEMTTPTGAAIIAANVNTFSPPPRIVARAVGYGAGESNFEDRPNLLRVIVGDVQTQSADPTFVSLTGAAANASGAAQGGAGAALGDVQIIEANIDDMNPEFCAHVTDLLFAAGALDVWWTPIVMKKGRPALTLSALSHFNRTEAIARVFLRETTSLGVRYYSAHRRVLERRSEIVATQYGPIAVKIGEGDAGICNMAPEYDACVRVAREQRVPLKQIYAAVSAAWENGQSGARTKAP